MQNSHAHKSLYTSTRSAKKRKKNVRKEKKGGKTMAPIVLEPGDCSHKTHWHQNQSPLAPSSFFCCCCCCCFWFSLVTPPPENRKETKIILLLFFRTFTVFPSHFERPMRWCMYVFTRGKETKNLKSYLAFSHRWINDCRKSKNKEKKKRGKICRALTCLIPSRKKKI